MRFFDRFFARSADTTRELPLYLHNTLSGTIERFTLAPGAPRVRMYNCGPTVYDRQHIGNLSMFVFTDILRRTLEYNGFAVKQVINITDVGHLTSDADEGDDKMTKGLKSRNLPLTIENMRTLGEENTAVFLEDLRALNIDTAGILFPRASDYVEAMIVMIGSLEDKTYAYRTADGMYFDTSMYPEYGALGNIDLGGQMEGARIGAVSGKRNGADFALWKFNSTIGWDSPWGKGFPGWHIECSAMIHKILGEPIDIHTGGIEHIPIHHNNEIAQSACATGTRTLARFWMHRAHIQIDGGKIAKSAGSVVYISDITERGFDPMTLRYLFLGAHYRTPMNFTWEALAAAGVAYQSLLQRMLDAGDYSSATPPPAYMKRFHERINDDLDTPGALAVLWEMMGDASIAKESAAAGLAEADTVLGLDLAGQRRRLGITLRKEVAAADLPREVRALIEEREAARREKHFARSDMLRKEIEDSGYSLEDAASGVRIFKVI